jgi:hypothetical protein
VVRVLIEMGASVNETREWHCKASFEAAANLNFEEGVQLLMEKVCSTCEVM